MQSADDLKARCAALERQLAALTSEVASNERKLRQSLQRELRLLHAENLQTLILEMTDGLRSAYGLPSVSLLLSDPDHDIRHLLIAAGTPAESFQNLVFVIV